MIFHLPERTSAAHLAVNVGQERHAQTIILHELAVVLVAADADHLRSELLELSEVCLEGLRLLGATGGAVFGVEEHLAAGKAMGIHTRDGYKDGYP